MIDWKELLAPIALPLAWMGSLEWRLRSKVSDKRFDDYKGYIKERFDGQKKQLDRIENHLNDK